MGGRAGGDATILSRLLDRVVQFTWTISAWPGPRPPSISSSGVSLWHPRLAVAWKASIHVASRAAVGLPGPVTQRLFRRRILVSVTRASARRGRPSEGRRVAVRLPPDVLVLLDRRAERAGITRAQVMRDILRAAVDSSSSDGVDRAQIQRMLRLTPAERVQHMAQVAESLSSIKGIARRR